MNFYLYEIIVCVSFSLSLRWMGFMHVQVDLELLILYRMSV